MTHKGWCVVKHQTNKQKLLYKFMDHSCVYHAFATVHCCLVVTWRERADLLTLVCDVYCDFVTFPFGILGSVWYLIVSIPDHCCLSYFESARKSRASLRHVLLPNDVSHSVSRCNVVFYALQKLQIHLNVCDTVQLLAGFPQFNGGKLEEVEYFKYVFVVYCVLESK